MLKGTGVSDFTVKYTMTDIIRDHHEFDRQSIYHLSDECHGGEVCSLDFRYDIHDTYTAGNYDFIALAYDSK